METKTIEEFTKIFLNISYKLRKPNIDRLVETTLNQILYGKWVITLKKYITSCIVENDYKI